MPRKQPRKKKSPRPKDARARARDAVQECFNNMAWSYQSLLEGSYCQAALDDGLVDQLIDALMEEDRAARVAQGIKDDKPKPEDEADLRALYSIEAGYIVGVQVGLRLAGGAR